jgi:hypothetical protein
MKVDSSARVNDATSSRSQSACTGSAFENMLCSMERDMWKGAASGFKPQHAREAAPTPAVSATHGATPDATEPTTRVPFASPTTSPVSNTASSRADQSMQPHALVFVDTRASFAESATIHVAQAFGLAPRNLNASRAHAVTAPRTPAFNTRDSEVSPDLRITTLNGTSLVIRLSASASEDSAAIAQHALDAFRRNNGSGAKPARLIVNGVEQDIPHITLTSDGDHHGD